MNLFYIAIKLFKSSLRNNFGHQFILLNNLGIVLIIVFMYIETMVVLGSYNMILVLNKMIRAITFIKGGVSGLRSLY